MSWSPAWFVCCWWKKIEGKVQLSWSKWWTIDPSSTGTENRVAWALCLAVPRRPTIHGDLQLLCCGLERRRRPPALRVKLIVSLTAGVSRGWYGTQWWRTPLPFNAVQWACPIPAAAAPLGQTSLAAETPVSLSLSISFSSTSDSASYSPIIIPALSDNEAVWWRLVPGCLEHASRCLGPTNPGCLIDVGSWSCGWDRSGYITAPCMLQSRQPTSPFSSSSLGIVRPPTLACFLPAVPASSWFASQFIFRPWSRIGTHDGVRTGCSSLRGKDGELVTLKNLDLWLQLVCTKIKLKQAI